jgi:hypothetical protein
MIGLLIFLYPLANLSFAGGFGADFRPKIEIEYKVILSTGMEDALKAYDPEFEPWKALDFEPFLRNIYTYGPATGEYFRTYQTLSAVIGDFNGDKIPDIALLGHNKTHEKKIVILSKNTIYKVVELLNYPLTDPLYPAAKKGDGNIGRCLEFVPPGLIKAEPAYNRPELTLKTDAFKYGGEQGSTLYFYKDGKFIDYPYSD